jgi:hypothetical protein
MFSRLRPRSVYDVLAVIGCFAALTTGGAYAANTIGSTDVIDESLLSRDIQNDRVRGEDILESTLGLVPNASRLDGRDSKTFARFGGMINGDGSVLQGAGFTVDRLTEGEYTVAFPAGTLSTSLCPPVATVTVFSGLVRHPQTSGRSCSGNGGGSFTIKTLDNDGVPHDTPFAFIAM